MAFELAKANARLVLAARSADKLEATAAKCRDLGASEVVKHSQCCSGWWWKCRITFSF